ncbi:MAG: Copper-binding lipoprotein NosL [Syntrophus sp. SKADARSKE-3]|nr:Copper-binding lipoprotein NosL [Syntrophus sp. SKADARSKE-3]
MEIESSHHKSDIRSSVYAACLMFGLICFLLINVIAGAAEKEMPKPTAKDKCPVCGMFVSKYPDWTTAILFKNGSHVFFDGAKDMFKYLFDMKRYDPSKKADDVQSVMVKDYYRLAWTDAHKAWFVMGSNIYGPMGRELIAMEKEGDAKEFMADHKGKRILRFEEVTREVVKNID